MEDDRGQLIIALDNLRLEDACRLVQRLGGLPHVWGFKVNDLLGLGYSVIDELQENGARGVMADPKWHDIPNTVANYAVRMASYEPQIVTVHASGGRKMIEAAVRALKPHGIRVAAITVLTSLNTEWCQVIYGSEPKDKVRDLAILAKDAGADLLVCSPQELSLLAELRRNGVLAGMKFICPAVRPASQAGQDDQARTLPAQAAIEAGADYLVAGRAIAEADDPVIAASSLIGEISRGLSVRK